MPREARIKILDGIYHVIVRGISELCIFQDDKLKEKYLSIFNKYQEIFKFKVYGFCIMNTHAHFIIGSNGADISKFMKSINVSYAGFYNKKNNRFGPVFCDRFKSLLITNDNYLLNASIYIHNNPSSIIKYINRVDEYKYSSILSYIDDNFIENSFMPVDNTLILKLLSSDLSKSKSLYRQNLHEAILKRSGKEYEEAEMELKDQKMEYVSGRSNLIRNVAPEKIIEFTSNSANMNIEDIKIKYKREPAKLRAVTVLFLRCLCDLKITEIGKILGNITSSDVSFLCSKGYKLINNDKVYSNIYKDFLTEFSVS